MIRVLVVWVVLSLSLAFVQSAAASGWVSEDPALPMAPQGELDAISCPSGGGDCVAVGGTQTPAVALVPLAEAWSNGQWNVEATPPLSPPVGDSQLLGVSCVAGSSSWCMAVGVTGYSVLIETRSADGWSILSSPVIAGESYAQLSSVSCTSATACVAVGFVETSSGAAPLAETWDGTSWSVQPVPLPPGDFNAGLNGVSCTSLGCVAVGDAEVDPLNPQGVPLSVSWDGTSWVDGSAQTPPNGTLGQLFGVSCSAGTLYCTAVGSYQVNGVSTVTLAEAGVNAALAPETTPNAANASNDNELDAIDCSSPDACTAVGVSNTRAQTLVERWNGTSWSIEARPNPTVGDYRRLLGVACPGPESCLAVGGGPAGADLGGPGPIGTTLSESWDGTGWSIEPMPDTEPLSTALAGISCGSATDCVAVGSFDDLSGNEQSLAELWDGTSWTASHPPSGAVGSTELSGVSCPAPGACVAVGGTAPGSGYPTPFAATWNGASWTASVPVLPPGAGAGSFDAVSCVSITDCVAVGSTSSVMGSAPLVEHLDASGWSVESDPLRAGEVGQLSGVSCPAAGDCIAVGEQDVTSTGTQTALVQQDSGSGWTTEGAFGPSGARLQAVDCVATYFCFAVGSGAANGSLVEWWDGLTWTPVPAQDPSTFDPLSGVSCVTASRCVAVGTFASSPGTLTLAEHWNGVTWTTTPTPNGIGLNNLLAAVSCPTTSTCFSAGYSSVVDGYFSDEAPVLSQSLGSARRWAPVVKHPTTVRKRRASAEQHSVSGDLGNRERRPPAFCLDG